MPKRIEITSGDYAAQWGLTDFYSECEDLLRSAVESCKDFETDWGCKKEIRYASVVRDGGCVVVTVTSHMDDLYEDGDLIYDALWERLHIEDEIPEEMFERIRDFAIDCGIEDQSEAAFALPRSATFEDICEAIEKLEDYTEASNTAMFNELCDLVEGEWKNAHAE